MPPRFTVPPEQREPLSKLRGLSSSELELFVSAVEAAPLTMYSTDLGREVAVHVEFLPAEDVKNIVSVLWQIEFMRYVFEAPREPFMADVHAAIAASGIAGESDAFMASLDRALKAPSLTFAAKARALLTDGNSYCRSRVLTDVRPVFGDSAEAPPLAALAVHHMTLSYHASGANVVDVIVSLDSDDIEDLIETLKRAQTKQRQLKQLMAATSTPFLVE